MVPLRKSIATSMDYRTGATAILEKDKPFKNARGFATVSLFDAETGKKVHESKTENLLTQEGFRFFRWAIFNLILSGYSGTKPPTYNGSNNYHPFSAFFLLDYNGPETDNIFPKNLNKMIGYSTLQTYSGGDIYRGTINVAESQFDFGSDSRDGEYLRMHFVFDWPTHSGNGTFNALAWGPNHGSFPRIPLTRSTPIYQFPEGTYYNDGYLVICYDGIDLWAINRESNSLPLYRLHPDTFEIIESFTLPSGLGIKHGFAADASFFYIYRASSPATIYKINKSTLEIVNSLNIGGASIGSIALDDNFLWCVIGTRLLKINPSNLSKIEEYTLPYSCESLMFDGTYLWSRASSGYISNAYRFLPSDPVGTFDANSFYFNWTPYTTGAFDPRDGSYWAAYNFSQYDNRQIVKAKPLFGAITKLASPITKTATNTMKVQYDFVFEF